MIPSKKSTAETDDGLLQKDSRDDKTAIELFLGGVAGWEAGLRRWLVDGSHLQD